MATTEVQIDSVRGAAHELKLKAKDLSRKMEIQSEMIDHKFEKTDAKIDQANKTDSKVDRLLYFFIGGILKGRFDFYMIKDVQSEFERKIASTVEGLS